jgi:hypothetical protein
MTAAMSDMTTGEAKAFVPARDFALSKQFYQDLGFVDAAHCCPFAPELSRPASD